MNARSFLAELIGTALLLAAVVGSGIMAENLSDSDGLALLANTAATCATLFVLISVFAPLSGAHFNPAVTLVMAALRVIRPRDIPVYLLAQFAGGILGVAAANVMFDLDALHMSQKIRGGAGQWLGEGIATFALLLTILGLRQSNPKMIPAAVACIIAGAYWFTSSTSFANPAVTIARAFSDSFAGIAPASVLGFILAQLGGASIAALTALVLWPEPKAERALS